jgi:circadian clock protein KaiC
VAFEEASERIIDNARGFGWGLDDIRPRNIFFLDAQPTPDLVGFGDFAWEA